MDKNPTLSKLNKLIPGSVLDTQRFGYSGNYAIWIEAKTLQNVANLLKTDPSLSLDWLENLSLVELEDVFIATYFLRSTTMDHQFIIRVSAVPPNPDGEIIFPSIQSIWPMGVPMEQEAQELFGVQFRSNFEQSPENKPRRLSKLLPEGWIGYPLRKNYQFPKEVLGIDHSPFSNRLTSKKTST